MTLNLKDHVFITLGDAQPFPGTVIELRPGWVRVTGRGSVEGSYFDSWFPESSPSVKIKPSATHAQRKQR